MNVKKTIAVMMFGALAVSLAACGGGDATPTRTRVAQADATQTPWIIYVPVTVTPGPEIATLEPTTTPSAPTATLVPPSNTPRPPTDVPPEQPTQAAVAPTDAAPAAQPTAGAPATAAAPPPTAPPSCGESYQVTNLTFPENGARRRARSGSGAGATIQFKFDPVVAHELDPKIGYRVLVQTPRNSQALYISHNEYLREEVVILNQQATYGLTLGDDMNATWVVDVIQTTGEFNDSGDDSQAPNGTIAVCGPTSPQFTIEIVVEE